MKIVKNCSSMKKGFIILTNWFYSSIIDINTNIYLENVSEIFFYFNNCL